MRKLKFLFFCLFYIFILFVIINLFSKPAYFYVTKEFYYEDTEDYKNTVYRFFYNGKQYLTLSGGNLRSVIISKKKHRHDFYINYNGKLLKYKNGKMVGAVANLDKDARDNNMVITKDGIHSGGVWIGENGDIFRTFLIFGIELSCDSANIEKLKKDYNLNITVKECNDYKKDKDKSGATAICVRQVYDKQRRIWNDDQVVLTQSESCLSDGCSNLSYMHNSREYKIVNKNEFQIETYGSDKFLDDRLLDKFEKEFDVKFNRHVAYVLYNQTSKYIVVKCLKCNSFFDRIMFVLDKKLNTQAIFYYDEPKHDSFFDFVVKNDELFIKTGNKVYIYSLKTFKLLKKIENVEFFSFLDR